MILTLWMVKFNHFCYNALVIILTSLLLSKSNLEVLKVDWKIVLQNGLTLRVFKNMVFMLYCIIQKLLKLVYLILWRPGDNTEKKWAHCFLKSKKTRWKHEKLKLEAWATCETSPSPSSVPPTSVGHVGILL